MFPRNKTDGESNNKLSEVSDENDDCKHNLDSSYELCTPVKTRASVGKSMVNKKCTPSPMKCTRSGRKIKRNQYLDYETDFNGMEELDVIEKMLPAEKNSALKELNLLKNEFSELKISTNNTATPRRKSARISEAIAKANNVTPREKLHSSNVKYSRSGRKIKQIQYSEEDSEISDVENDITDKSYLLPSTSQNRTPRRSTISTPTHTKSGRKIKKTKYFAYEDNELGVKKSDVALLEVDGSVKEGAIARNSTKLHSTPKENISPSVTFKKSKKKIKEQNSIEESEQETEDSDLELSKDVKPSALYDDDNKFGKQMFGFQTPKSRYSMLDKASQSANKISKTPLKTPRSSVKAKDNLKTPYNMRKRIKKGIAKEISQQSIDDLLEDSGSEYNPSSTSSDDNDVSDEDTENIEISGVMPLETTAKHLNEYLLNRKSRASVNNFMFTAEDYFENKSLHSLTSNHTLSQLKTPRLNQCQLSNILNSIANKHEKSVCKLHLENEVLFPRWLFSMNEGFNILVYGVGSKKQLLNAFHEQFLSRSYVVVINGYFPGLLLKDILDCITNDVLRFRSVPTQPLEIVEFICAKLHARNNRLFLLVHNIDGPALRCDKIQSVLAQLAADSNIHLVASLDHINSPLLWDQNKLSQFNFTWEDGTSFLPYLNETSYETSLMVQKSGGIALAGLKNIFKSLNSNSRKIFKLLLEYQLKDNSNKSQGMLFSELYRECRNSFLVSSDLALRTQLTEFFDHQLIKWKRDNEHLIIPLDNSVLKKFQEYLETENG